MKKLIEHYIANIHHKGKRYSVKALLKVLPIRHIRSFYGPIMVSNPCDKTNVYAISGEYGRIVSNHVETLPKDSIFMDIGSNYGIFSFIAAKHLTDGQVISFEPNPYIYRHFLENLELNKPNNLISFHCALGEKDCFFKLQSDKNHSGKSHVKTQTNNGEDCALQYFTVPVFNISEWNALNNLLKGKDINIKIDVEGYEYNILRALVNAPWFSQVKSIVAEIDSKNLALFKATAADLYNDLEKIGFKPTYGLDTKTHYDEIFVR